MNITISIEPGELLSLIEAWRATPPQQTRDLKGVQQHTQSDTAIAAAAAAAVVAEDTPATKQDASRSRNRAPLQQPEHAVIELAQGNVAWQVEIDGIPTRWMLDYTQGNLPATRGRSISFRDKQYRLSHIYSTSLKVTSQEAEDYTSSNHLEVVS